MEEETIEGEIRKIKERLVILESRIATADLQEYITEAMEKLRKGGCRQYISLLPLSDTEKEDLWEKIHLQAYGRKPKIPFAEALKRRDIETAHRLPPERG